MKQLNLYYLGGGGGGSVPDGKTVTPINDVTIWQKCAGIANPTYTTLAEILGDTGILQTLMASNNAVDYLVRCKAFMATRSLVPIMTSNNTPSGVAFADLEYSIYLAYRVFDNNSSTEWSVAASGAASSVNHYVGYDFETPTIVNKIFILPGEAGNTGSNGCRVKNYRIEASNDKVSWDILTSQTYTAANSTGETVTFTNNTAYRYYRCYVVDNYTTEFTINIRTLTFYSPVGICDTADAMTAIGQNNYCANTLLADSEWVSAICNSTYKERVLNKKNPDMTSNTTPSGRAYGSSVYSNRAYYYGFDGTTATSWYSQDGSQVGQYIAYEFASDVKIVHFDMTASSTGNTSGFKIQKSEDGITWYDVSDTYNLSVGGNRQITGAFANTSAVKYWRIYLTSGTANPSGNGFMLADCRFYGRKDV